ncbi:MAG: hypothetical protein IKK08_03685 [Clostridia bacterium]|nr:hypothetical protein [Clostridia bacterium]
MCETMKETLYFGKPSQTYTGPLQVDFGDDARPYIGRCLISVADGTGARGGVPQRSINGSLLRPQESFYAATQGCLGKHPERYEEMYAENFDYLLTVGGEYAAVGARKSGYFGSRLTSIFMRRILEDKLYRSEENLKAQMHALANADEEERDTILANCEQTFAEELGKRLKRAVSNCGLNWDYTRDDNLSLMGTTYSGVVFLEEEDEVHLLSIQAGDSLAAVLMPLEYGNSGAMLAMRRLLPAQERESDGGLTNCVAVNHPFYFRCGYHRVRKPCAILTCSDGCFDAFPSDRWFEHFVMSRLGDREHGDLSDAMKSMHSYFATPVSGGNGGLPVYVSTDDCSTMAIAAFGFDHFMRLCKMAEHRLRYMNDRYGMAEGQAGLALTAEEEEQLEENRVNRNMEKTSLLRPYAERCWEHCEWVRRRSMDRLEEPANRVRVEAEIKTELSRNDEDTRECNRLEGELRKKIEYYWLHLREKPQKQMGIHTGRRPEEDPADKLAQITRERRAMEFRIGDLMKEISRIAGQLAGNTDVSLPAYDEALVGDCVRWIDQNVTQIQNANREMERCLRRSEALRSEGDAVFHKLIKDESPAITAVCNAFLNNRQPAAFGQLNEEVQQSFIDLADAVRRLRERIRRRSSEVEPAVRESFSCKLFMNRPVALIEEAILQHPDTLPEDLRRELQSIMDELDRKYPAFTEKSRREQENNRAYTAEFEAIMTRKE